MEPKCTSEKCTLFRCGLSWEVLYPSNNFENESRSQIGFFPEGTSCDLVARTSITILINETFTCLAIENLIAKLNIKQNEEIHRFFLLGLHNIK